MGRSAALLSASGAVLYAAGYALGVFWQACLWVVLCGSLLNLCGFLFLVWVGPSGRYAYALKLGLPVVCFGMLLDLLSGLAATYPNLFIPAYLGAEDGVRLRMLRLARVAVIALCVLTLLYQGLAQQKTPQRRFTEWGHLSLLCGTIGMPIGLDRRLPVVDAAEVLVAHSGDCHGVWHPWLLWGWRGDRGVYSNERAG